MGDMGTLGQIQPRQSLQLEVPPPAACMRIFATGASIQVATWKIMGWIYMGKGPALDTLEGRGQDQGCDGAGAALGVPPCAGVASAPLPVKFHCRSHEPEQSKKGVSRRRGCPGLARAVADSRHPSRSLSSRKIWGGFNAESSLLAAFHMLSHAALC